jgi:hypothetical protein
MDRLYIGIVIGILIYFLYSKLFGGNVSGFTMEPFSAMTDRAAVMTSFQTQTAALTNELKAKLTDAINAQKSTEELITISNSYADQSNALNKAYSEWQLRHRTDVVAASPAPAPRTQV